MSQLRVPYSPHQLSSARVTVPKTEAKFAHDVGRVATYTLQPSYSFSGGRTFGVSHAQSTPKRYSGAMSETLASLVSSGSSGHSRTGNPSPVLPNSNGFHVSNHRNAIGTTIWTGVGSPGNRSYYPLPLGRHTFSSRSVSPNVAAQPW